jgi:DNA mismatch repair protein MutS
LVRKIELPIILYNTNELIDNTNANKLTNAKGVYNVYLANHTLKQLNIINNESGEIGGNDNLSCVLNFLDKTVSIMGSRRLKSVLLNPTYNVEWLNTEYNRIEICLKYYNNVVLTIRKTIKGICDIDKLIRKIVLRNIDYNKLYSLYNGLNIIKNVLNIWKITGEDTDKQTVSVLLLIDYFNNKFDILNNNNNNNADNNITIKMGINKELDDYNIEYKKKNDILNQLIFELNKIYNSTTKKSIENAIKIHSTEKSGISLIITKTRGKQLKNILDKSANAGFIIDDIFISGKDIKMVSSSGNEDYIECQYINDLCKDIGRLNTLIIEKNEAVFNEILNDFEETHLYELEEIAEWIGNIDLCCTKAYIAEEYNYCKPIIHIPLVNEIPIEKSFVEMNDLRHVLIEHLVKNETYIPNDVYLGSPDNNKDGLLIFGTNMIGKTSLIRAVGIAIFIAQSGFYVPCSSMRYNPYRSIMTRIVCNDNLFKGISTFAMEMIELRIILRDADKRTLVLGDELGASTEHKSAFSIFMATLMELSRIECTFLFTTHFYEILNMSELTELKRLALCHLEVSFNGDKLCYNRKLKDGSGIANYGLECCKSMYFKPEFMEIAYKLRNKYYPELSGVLNWEKTTYNASKLKSLCENCGQKMGEEIHHIEPQSNANKKGFLVKGDKIGIHKNSVGNLMSLCEMCHQLIHSIGPTKI